MMSDYNPNSIWTSVQQRSSAPHAGALGDVPRGKGGKENGLLWFFVVLAAFAAGTVFYFFFLRTPNFSISMLFTKPDQVFIGDPFMFSVSLSNNSETVLKNATFALTLPDGFSFVGQSPDQRVMEQSIGDLSPGVIVPENFNVIATGNPNSIGHITAKLIYGTDATGKAQLESDGSADVITGSPAVGLTFTVPQSVFGDQQFSITVNYHNNTSHDIQNVALQMQYPAVFIFATSSAPSKSANNTLWNLGTIAAGAGGTVTITGIMNKQASASYPFTGELTTEFSGAGYTLDTETSNVVVAASPLLLAVTLNNTSTYIAKAGDSLDYVVSYVNNSDVTLQDAVIQATFTGAMYDFPSLKTDGSFNSITNTVTWSRATHPELASLAPGQSGSVEVTVGTKQSFPITSVNNKDYVLAVQAQIQSPTIPPNTSASSTISMANLQDKVGGDIAVTSTGYRVDMSGIVNNGPYPPVVNEPSQYTIHWNVTDYSTDVRNVIVSAYLQSGSVFTGQVKSNINTQPTYDAATGIVTWTIPSMSATTGVLNAPADAVFQVENTPAVNQVNQMVTLLGITSLSADDTFTSSTLRASAKAVTTHLPEDPTVSKENGQVVQSVAQ